MYPEKRRRFMNIIESPILSILVISVFVTINIHLAYVDFKVTGTIFKDVIIDFTGNSRIMYALAMGSISTIIAVIMRNVLLKGIKKISFSKFSIEFGEKPAESLNDIKGLGTVNEVLLMLMNSTDKNQLEKLDAALEIYENQINKKERFISIETVLDTKSMDNEHYRLYRKISNDKKTVYKNKIKGTANHMVSLANFDRKIYICLTTEDSLTITKDHVEMIETIVNLVQGVKENIKEEALI